MTDSLPKKPYLSNFKPIAQQSSYDLTVPFDTNKENSTPQTAGFSVDVFNINANGKRGLMEAAPIKESRPVKKQKPSTGAPNTDLSSTPISESNEKPHQSYSQLIANAILSSEQKRLTLAQIYSHISDRYPYYRQVKEGWQNSIRHNLSLHKHFIKIDRPKDDPGKGSYWAIQPGQEAQFLKERPARKATASAENIPVMSTRLEPPTSRPATAPAPAHGPFEEPTLPPHAMQFAQPPINHRKFSMSMVMPPDVSSDATIPFSDLVAANEADPQPTDNEVTLDLPPFSPLTGAMHSSPPVARVAAVGNGTPSPLNARLGSSHGRLEAKKDPAAASGKADSGYYSSMNSSAMRPPAFKKPSGERSSHRSHRKEGRAEAAIMRMRNSTPTSPTQSRSRSVQRGLLDSSPLARTGAAKAYLRQDPTLTLAAASPTTNLRIHRANLSRKFGSPVRPFDASVKQFSPLRTDTFHCESNFEDALNMDTGLENFWSPIKASPRLNRTVSTPNLSSIKRISSSKLQNDLFMISRDVCAESLLDTPSRAFEPDTPSRFFIDSPTKGTLPRSSINDLASVNDWSALDFDSNDFMGIGAIDDQHTLDETIVPEKPVQPEQKKQSMLPPPQPLQAKQPKVQARPQQPQPRSRPDMSMMSSLGQSASGYDISLGFAKIGAKPQRKANSSLSSLR